MGQKKYFGSFDELKEIVRACGLRGKWSEIPERRQRRFDGKHGEIINWWPHKGTLQIQGQNIEDLEQRLCRNLRRAGDNSNARPHHFEAIEKIEELSALYRVAKKELARKLGKRVDQIKIYVEI